MKQKLILSTLMLVCSVLIFSFNQKKTTINESFTIVELYTSQGCSSCPRADKVLEQIAETYKSKNVFPLGFHVDYWDRFGWKDTFSKHEFSQRQYRYGQRFRNVSVYTPQMVINGSLEFNGGNKSKAFAQIDRGLKIKSTVQVDGKISELKTKLSVEYTVSDVLYDRYAVNVVLVKNEETVTIKRGENSNKEIAYHNIVIDLKEVSASKNGRIVLEKPQDYDKGNYSVIVFVQENNYGPIIGAKKLSHS